MSKTESEVVSLDELTITGSAINSEDTDKLEVDYTGKVYRWEVAPGQEELDEDETQEIIVIPLNEND